MRGAVMQCLEVVAVTLLGLMAGFFFAFAVDVVPAMAQLDGPTYVTVQQWINRVVRNAVFGLVYFGSTLMPFVVALAWFATRQRGRAMAWLAIAGVYFVGVFWLTRSVNVPINDALAQWSASAAPSGWQDARDTWNQSNIVRSVASIICFVASLALVTVSGKHRA